MHTFFSTDVSNNQLILSREESTHAVKVLRLQPGDKAVVLDGKGHRYYARYEDSRQKHCFFSILSVENVPCRAVHLTMAVAPTKQIDRFEWFLEKATEIGVEKIIPIISRHSERKVVKTERSQKILIAAMKQSQTAWLPEIMEPISLNNFLNQSENDATKYIAHCLRQPLPHLHKEQSAPMVEILIGPEGDFDAEEVQLAMDSDFKEISLGQNRLRTETAAIVAVHCMALKHL